MEPVQLGRQGRAGAHQRHVGDECARRARELARAALEPGGRHWRLPEPRGAAWDRTGLRRAHPRAAPVSRARCTAPPTCATCWQAASSPATTIPHNVQDAYTLRCIPQVHGAVRDAIAYARWAMDIELNAVSDNPLLFVDEASGEVTVLSGGNFHGEPLAIAMDYLGIAMTELGNISERRLTRLTDESSNVPRAARLPDRARRAQLRLHDHAVHGGGARHGEQGPGAPRQRGHDSHLGQRRGPRQHGADGRASSCARSTTMSSASSPSNCWPQRKGSTSASRCWAHSAELGQGTRHAYNLIRSRCPVSRAATLFSIH